MRIGIVDDDYTTRKLISDFLEDKGFETVLAARPEKLLDVENCDVIVMDVRIGTEPSDRYAGIDYILEQRRSRNIHPDTLVIFISNFGKDRAKNLLQQVGDHQWLDKPIDFVELEQTITTFISERGGK